MNADKLVNLVNAHVLANTPKTGVTCSITPYWTDDDIAANAAMGNNAADLASIQAQEQAAFEASQPKLDASEAQEIELVRFLGNEEADRKLAVINCNLPLLTDDEQAEVDAECEALDDEELIALKREEAEHARLISSLNSNLQGR